MPEKQRSSAARTIITLLAVAAFGCAGYMAYLVVGFALDRALTAPHETTVHDASNFTFAEGTSRQNPAESTALLRLNSGLYGDVAVGFTQVDMDADSLVDDANDFDQPAPDGQKYVAARVTITNLGDEDARAVEAMSAVLFADDEGSSHAPKLSIDGLPGHLPNTLPAGSQAQKTVVWLAPDGARHGAFTALGEFVEAR